MLFCLGRALPKVEMHDDGQVVHMHLDGNGVAVLLLWTRGDQVDQVLV